MALLHTSKENIFLSSDSEEILGIGTSYGINSIRRPPSLAEDTSPEELTWKHCILNYLPSDQLNEPLIILPPTSPFRNLSLLDESLASLSETTPLIVSAYPSSRSPWFNMVKSTNHNQYQILLSDATYSRRQDAPITFDLTTCFFTLIPSFFLKTKQSRYELPFNIVQVDREQCLDIDDPYDLDKARTHWRSLGATLAPSKRSILCKSILEAEQIVACDKNKMQLYSASNLPEHKRAILYLMGYVCNDSSNS